MDEVKVVSFDAEGTLVTPDFSYAVWFEAIPERYAERNGIDLEMARKIVEEEYRKVGDHRLEWYDVRYWFDRFGLGVPDPVMERCQGSVCYYTEVEEVLSFLSSKYKLVVASGSTRDFLNHLLRDIEPYFTRVFSSLTDYKQLKTPEFYLNMCQAMGVQPEQVVHVGDNLQVDFVAPREVGIKAFYLDRKKQRDSSNALVSLIQLKAYLTAEG
jgi:FMN phosphatase YigB (HAD superfamily)